MGSVSRPAICPKAWEPRKRYASECAVLPTVEQGKKHKFYLPGFNFYI